MASPAKMLNELSRFLGQYGISIESSEFCSRHRKVWVSDGEKRAMIIVSVSPSDHRAYYNIAKSARNALREAR